MGVPRKIEGLMLRSDHDRVVDSMETIHKERMSRVFRDGAFIGFIVGAISGVIGGVVLALVLIQILVGA